MRVGAARLSSERRGKPSAVLREQLFRTHSVNQRPAQPPSAFNFPPSFVSRQDAGQRTHACTSARGRVCVCVKMGII